MNEQSTMIWMLDSSIFSARIFASAASVTISVSIFLIQYFFLHSFILVFAILFHFLCSALAYSTDYIKINGYQKKKNTVSKCAHALVWLFMSGQRVTTIHYVSNVKTVDCDQSSQAHLATLLGFLQNPNRIIRNKSVFFSEFRFFFEIYSLNFSILLLLLFDDFQLSI